MNLEIRNIKIDGRIKSAYTSSFSKVNDEIYNLIIIGSKVLLCDKSYKNINIDIDRLFDEFVYFKYYSNMSNIYLLNFFMPLMIVNRGFGNYCNIVVDVAEKLCKFYGKEEKKYNYIMDVFCYDIIFRSVLSGKNNITEILHRIKEGIIEMNPYENNRSENVKFQIAKIKYIENLHGCIDNYEVAKSETMYKSGINVIDIFQYAKGYISDEDIFLDDGENSVLNFMQAILLENESINYGSIRNVEFIKLMSEYILKLRYNEINTKKYNMKSTPRNFLNMNVGEEFIDPIMNRGKIVCKEIINEDGTKKYHVSISTKTGKYHFKYNII